MKFTVLSQEVQVEQESDYETAVEMSHATIEERQVRLCAENGAIVVLCETNISTRSSFLEPDFDQFERDGSVVYRQEAGPDEPENTRSVRACIEAPTPLPAMSEDDWSNYRRLELTGGWEDDDCGLSDAQRRRLRAYSDYEVEGPTRMGPQLDEGQARAWADALSGEVEDGATVELPVSSAAVEILNEAAAVSRQAQDRNSETRLLNQINENAMRAKQDLGETVRRAHLGFAPR